MEKKDKNWAWSQIVDIAWKGGNMTNTEEQIIILAQINTLKDMQIFLLKKEQKLQEELNKLKAEENK